MRHVQSTQANVFIIFNRFITVYPLRSKPTKPAGAVLVVIYCRILTVLHRAKFRLQVHVQEYVTIVATVVYV